MNLRLAAGDFRVILALYGTPTASFATWIFSGTASQIIVSKDVATDFCRFYPSS